jgi:hypothetical protein
VARIRAKNLGDDIIGLNSYKSDGALTYPQMEQITVSDVKGCNIGTGRGVAVNGCKDVRISDVMVDCVAQAAVLIGVDANTYSSENVHVEGVVARNTGRAVPNGGTSGAVYVTSLNGGSISNVVGGAVTITSTALGVIWDDQFSSNDLVTGQEVFSRELLTSSKPLTSGALFLSYFTARKTENIQRIRTHSTTPATATPQLVRFGIYEPGPNGDLTLVASTINDIGIYSMASSAYEKTLPSAYQLVKGRRYIFGVLVVTSLGIPAVAASPAITATDAIAKSPRLAGVLIGQTDLPPYIPLTSIGPTAQRIYAAFLP